MKVEKVIKVAWRIKLVFRLFIYGQVEKHKGQKVHILTLNIALSITEKTFLEYQFENLFCKCKFEYFNEHDSKRKSS